MITGMHATGLAGPGPHASRGRPVRSAYRAGMVAR